MSDESSQNSLKKEIESLEQKIGRLEELDSERLEDLEIDEDIDIRARLIARQILKARKDEDKKEDKTVFSSSFEPAFAASPMATSGGSDTALGVTGSLGRINTPRLNAKSLNMLGMEIFASRQKARIEHKFRMGEINNANIYERMWAVTQIGKAKQERMIDDLRIIEGRTGWRIRNMNSLSLSKAQGSITAEQELRLKRLQDEELSRYWIRQRIVQDRTIQEQQTMNFLRPVGEGAYGVIPYTYLTRYDQLSSAQKKSAKWIFDNVMLRFQGQIMGKFIPKISNKPWFAAKHKDKAEREFDDVNDEIHDAEVFYKKLKKGQAELEDMEEEMAGYDRFTVEEEKEIKKYVKEKVAEMKATEKEQEWY